MAEIRTYLQGHDKAMIAVQQMSRDELLEHIDYLYGRDRLRQNFTLTELRQEAYRQTRLDFLNAEAPNYWQMMKILKGA